MGNPFKFDLIGKFLSFFALVATMTFLIDQYFYTVLGMMLTSRDKGQIEGNFPSIHTGSNTKKQKFTEVSMWIKKSAI